MAEVRVALIDDHDVVRFGLQGALDDVEDFAVVAAESTGAAGLAATVRQRPDVVLVDLALPDANGTELCREMAGRSPGTACVLYTDHDDDEAMVSALLAGAPAYLSKAAQMDEVVQIVRQVAEGRRLLSLDAARDALERRRREAASRPNSPLNAREARVCDSLADGLTDAQIAGALQLPVSTVKREVTRVLHKLDLAVRAEPAALASRLDLQQRRVRREGHRHE